MKNRSVEKLREYLSQKSREAYKDPFLIANVVLSKQETRGRVLERYLADETPPRITFSFKTKMFFLYAIKNFLSLILCLVTAFFHRVSRQKFYPKETGEIIILDTFFIASHILKEEKFEDIYFKDLSQYLKKIKKTYVYTPRLSGTKNPFDLFRVFKILKENNIPVLTHFQMLDLSDYLDTARFFFLYPFSVLRFIKNLGNSYEDELLRYGLWTCLNSVAIEFHLRFLLGKQLSRMKFDSIKCIGWFENQASDKTFYRGLRYVSKKTEIIGTQLLWRSDTIIHSTPDEHEIPFNVVPDRLLVNGPGYCFLSDNIEVEVGPSLRDKFIFEYDQPASNGEFILILMPYHHHVADFILSVINEVDWSVPVKIKFHPITEQKLYEPRIPKKFSTTNEPIPDLLPKVLIAVGRGSGVQVQVAACGIPVIDIENPNEFSLGALPQVGKGIIWDRATNAEEVTRIAKQFEKSLQSNPIRFREEGLRIKSLYFSEPTEELIHRAFRLD